MAYICQLAPYLKDSKTSQTTPLIEDLVFKHDLGSISHPTYNSQGEFSVMFDRVKILLFINLHLEISFLSFGYKLLNLKRKQLGSGYGVHA